MDQTPSWDHHYGPRRPEEDTDDELRQFNQQVAFHNPNFPHWPGPGPGPTAPGNDPAIRFGEHVPAGYSAEVGQPTTFLEQSAFETPHPDPVGFSMQPPTSNNWWNPTSSNQPSSTTHFHGHGVSNWAPPPDWDVPNTSSLFGSESFVTAQGSGYDQTFHLMQASLLNPIATYPGQAFGNSGGMRLETPQQPRSQHSQHASQSTQGHRPSILTHITDWIHMPLPRLRSSTPQSIAVQSIEACWHCKNCHTKCEGGIPCHRCKTSSGNSGIPCRRGHVSDTAAELPFLCPSYPSKGVRSLEPPFLLPPGFHHAVDLLEKTRQRRVQKIKEASHAQNQDIFSRVVNTKVPHIRCFKLYSQLEQQGLLSALELPYDELIVNIVWELKDNPEAAKQAGIEAVEDLVTLFEAASLCESQFGHHTEKRRLVYSSLHLLLHSLEALRLSGHNMLTGNVHEYCAQYKKCISPAFHGLARYAPRYAEALTLAMFHKRRDKDKNWLLVFYSLCIQRHVRCALMSLEEGLRSAGLSAAGMQVVDYAQPPCSAGYLRMAVCLFQRISMQNRGKLAKKISTLQAKPSVYLQQPLRSSSSRSSSSWQKRDDEGISEYLGRAIQIPDNYALSSPLDTSVDSDSDVTMMAPSPPAMAEEAAEIINADGECADSFIGSTYSKTSYEDSDRSTLDEGYATTSTASVAGSLTPSVRSVSTVTQDYSMHNYADTPEHMFGSMG